AAHPHPVLPPDRRATPARGRGAFAGPGPPPVRAADPCSAAAGVPGAVDARPRAVPARREERQGGRHHAGRRLRQQLRARVADPARRRLHRHVVRGERAAGWHQCLGPRPGHRAITADGRRPDEGLDWRGHGGGRAHAQPREPVRVRRGHGARGDRGLQARPGTGARCRGAQLLLPLRPAPDGARGDGAPGRLPDRDHHRQFTGAPRRRPDAPAAHFGDRGRTAAAAAGPGGDRLRGLAHEPAQAPGPVAFALGPAVAAAGAANGHARKPGRL
ncbi:MAG: hypothetical protein AVDCRST_MAG51-1070, partial [uncultured Ramlibacter sp.]